MKRAVFLGGTFSAVMSACAPLGPPASIIDLNENLAALRSAFNASSDRTRLILLLSPT